MYSLGASFSSSLESQLREKTRMLGEVTRELLLAQNEIAQLKEKDRAGQVAAVPDYDGDNQEILSNSVITTSTHHHHHHHSKHGHHQHSPSYRPFFSFPVYNSVLNKNLIKKINPIFLSKRDVYLEGLERENAHLVKELTVLRAEKRAPGQLDNIL